MRNINMLKCLSIINIHFKLIFNKNIRCSYWFVLILIRNKLHQTIFYFIVTPQSILDVEVKLYLEKILNYNSLLL